MVAICLVLTKVTYHKFTDKKDEWMRIRLVFDWVRCSIQFLNRDQSVYQFPCRKCPSKSRSGGLMYVPSSCARKIKAF